MNVNTSQVSQPSEGRTRRRAADFRQSARYITQMQAAEYLGVTDRTIREMIADGRLTGYRCGPRLVRLRRDEIDAAMRPFGGAA